MIKEISSAISRFNHNIWMASLGSRSVTTCIGVFLALVTIVAIGMIVVWPLITLSALSVATAARLIYAGVTAR